MSIFVCGYELESLMGFNSQAKSRRRRGALLKVPMADGGFGYADLHPWPELGDPNLEECLKLKGPLFQRALKLARMDGEARGAGLFLQPQPLPSHRLLRDVDATLKESDSVFKLKCGADLPFETSRLQRLYGRLKGVQKVRLDFNMSLQATAFDRWMDENAAWLLARLDFIEDPCRFEAAIFSRWRSILAFDRVDCPLDFHPAIKVVKPAREDMELDPHFQNGAIERIVFTHNMDHPLGQRAARVCASRFYERYPRYLDVCGLDAFDGYVLRDESLSQPEAHETGWGLNRYLAERKWIPL